MKLFGYDVCTPAAVYFVIAAIIMVIGFIFAITSQGPLLALLQLLSQFLSIVFCTVILTLICTGISPILSWIFTGLIILLTVTGVITISVNRT